MNRSLRGILAGGLLALSPLPLLAQSAKPVTPGKAGSDAPVVAKPASAAPTTGKPAPAGPVKPGLQASMDRGKLVYTQQCLACHQADAGGVPRMNPPLIKTKWILGDKTTLVQVVLKGMTGPIDVDGDNYHNVMAPHSELSDQQIADVLTYVRNNFGNKAKAVSAAEVKAIRAQTK
jgi:mono/diheme cytochrome c family protein